MSDFAPKRIPALSTIFGVATIVLLLDQLTKLLVVYHLPLWATWSITPEFGRLISVTHGMNTGAAFGMFPQLGAVFAIIAGLVIVGIIVFHHYLPSKNGWIRLSLGLQLGGALGNLTDRIFRGYVVDFIDIGFWPIFNIADLAIVMGLAILAYYLWQGESNLTIRPELPNISEADRP